MTKLPPSLEELRYEHGLDDDVIRAVAHEACRLQREADARIARTYRLALTGPLVVPNPEDLG